jgi:hypothetical protein
MGTAIFFVLPFPVLLLRGLSSKFLKFPAADNVDDYHQAKDG